MKHKKWYLGWTKHGTVPFKHSNPTIKTCGKKYFCVTGPYPGEEATYYVLVDDHNILVYEIKQSTSGLM